MIIKIRKEMNELNHAALWECSIPSRRKSKREVLEAWACLCCMWLRSSEDQCGLLRLVKEGSIRNWEGPLGLFYFFFFDMYTLIYLFIWSHWVFVTARGLSLVAESGSYSLFAVHGLLILVAAFFLQSTDSGHAGFSWLRYRGSSQRW